MSSIFNYLREQGLKEVDLPAPLPRRRYINADELLASIQRELDDNEDTALRYPTDPRQDEWTTERDTLRWVKRLIERRAEEVAA